MSKKLPIEILGKAERALQKRIDKLDSAGVTDDRLFKKVLEGLEAGEEEETLRDGEIIKSIKPNLLLQHKWTETALRMKGHLVPIEIKNEAVTVNNKFQINISASDIDRLEKINKEIEDLNKRLKDEPWQRGEVIEAEVL